MRRKWCIVIVALGLVSDSSGQRSWPVPKLKELGQFDVIEQGKTVLTARQSALLKQLSARIIGRCVEDPGPGDPTTAEQIFRQLRAGRIALSAQGDSAVVVQGSGGCMCGAVGNCPLWLLSDGPHPALLLRTVSVQTFAIEEHRSTRLYDLILGTHGSAMETDLQRFQFDGAKYRRTACATVKWDDGSGNALDPARVEERGCR